MWVEHTFHRRRRQARLNRLTTIEYEMIMTEPVRNRSADCGGREHQDGGNAHHHTAPARSPCQTPTTCAPARATSCMTPST